MSSGAAGATLSPKFKPPSATTGVAAREELEAFDAQLAAAYWRNESIETLVGARTTFMDALLLNLWHAVFDSEPIALYAVGGYGRGELLPQSDLDLLILCAKPHAYRNQIERFVHEVFDLHLEVGHSVRALGRVKKEAKGDLTIATALFENRLLAGPADLDAKFQKILGGRRLWPPKDFFRAKLAEQEARHKLYDNVEGGLEPNVKESPGGLRDVNVAMWVCERQFQTSDPMQLEALGVLTAQERQWLTDGARFLTWVRFGVHLLAGRKDDRLQFEHQRTLAQRLGYVDTENRRGVERFMHEYYRHVLALREVNDILLQHFDEAILRARERVKVERINDRFEVRNGYLQTCNDDVFANNPGALLEQFVIMANRRDIAGVRASTIRLIREHADLIDDAFRNDPANADWFMQLLRAPYTLVSQLTRMRRYGLLSRYLPEFGAIVGQMQHDLFHVYTVDAHTMQVIRNMRRLHYRIAQRDYPVAHHCVRHLPKVELLYVAGLYHDIAKGRGGNHSELGAIDVARFCKRHNINQADTELVVWLVEAHLVMSDTAQRKDIYDPEVITEFAHLVKSEMRLNYLYALTVADINATNPTLWNNWRATLMRQLYSETRRALRRGLESPVDRASSVEACQDNARERLTRLGVAAERIEPVWDVLDDDFFLRHTPREVARLTKEMAQHDLHSGPLILLGESPRQLTGEGATIVYVYAQDRPLLFATCVVTFDRLLLSVLEARIHTGATAACNRFVVLEESGEDANDNKARRREIQTALQQALTHASSTLELSQRRPTRQQRHCPGPATSRW